MKDLAAIAHSCSGSDQEPLGPTTLQQCLAYNIRRLCVRAPTYKNAHTPLQGNSFDPSSEDTLPSNIMDLPQMNIALEVISDDENEEPGAPEVLPSAVADDGKDSSAAVAPAEPETKPSEAAEAAGDGHGQEDDESFDVADYEALTV